MNLIKKIFTHIFIDGLSGMATGLFATLIVGTIIQQIGTLVGEEVGTSMLQVPNIMRKLVIWLPAILSSAILGPISTMVVQMTNNATGSGMGSAGFVGQIMTWQTMTATEDPTIVLIKIMIMQFVLPAALTLFFSEGMRQMNWIKEGDMALEF